jgi:hypothetical protein
MGLSQPQAIARHPSLRWASGPPHQPVLVQVYAWGWVMGLHLRRTTTQAEGVGDLPIEEWPYLDQEVLLATRSRKVFMTCHWYRHHAGANCIPLLTCQLHQALIAKGEHLTHRCQGWTDDMVRQRGWAPEVA